MKPIPNLPRRTRGFALATVLILMVVAMLLVLAAVRASAAQEHLVANQRAWLMAYAGAEAASRDAERWLYEFTLRGDGAALAADAANGGFVYGSADVLANANYRNFAIGRTWATAGSRALRGADYTHHTDAVSASAALAAQPRYLIEDLGRFRPPGAGVAGEGGVSGNSGYEGSAGLSPAGNADLRVFRTLGKSLGPGAEEGSAFVVTVWSIFAGRAQG
jgi:Tfp pilus assembly protein PilX